MINTPKTEIEVIKETLKIVCKETETLMSSDISFFVKEIEDAKNACINFILKKENDLSQSPHSEKIERIFYKIYKNKILKSSFEENLKPCTKNWMLWVSINKIIEVSQKSENINLQLQKAYNKYLAKSSHQKVFLFKRNNFIFFILQFLKK